MGQIRIDADTGKPVRELRYINHCDGCGKEIGLDGVPHLSVRISVCGSLPGGRTPTVIGIRKPIDEPAIIASGDMAPRFSDDAKDGHWSGSETLTLCIGCGVENDLCRDGRPK